MNIEHFQTILRTLVQNNRSKLLLAAFVISQLQFVQPTLAAQTSTPPMVATAKPQEKSPGVAAATVESHFKWFEGSVEQAFALAKEQKKPVFLYWGAVWCPPCNEIKAEIFSKARFAELMTQVVPVYLDGDSDRAQVWADKLHVSGYPTLLVLRNEGSELMRYSETVNMEEFESAFTSTLASNRPFKETVQKALDGTASRDDWRLLAFFSWTDPSSDPGLSDDNSLQTHQKLADLVPPNFLEERALLAGSLLEQAAGTDVKEAKPNVKKVLDDVRVHATQYLDSLFATSETVVAARRVLLYSASDIVKWIYPAGQNTTARSELIARWKKALATIANAPQMSVDTRTATLYPEIQFERLDSPSQELPALPSTKPRKNPVSEDLRARLRAAAAKADVEATSKYVRHAAISNAADLLAEAGDAETARAVLLKELKSTDTPWYIEADLSALEDGEGNTAEALKWSAASVKSAQGNSTKLQWMAADLMLNLRHLAALQNTNTGTQSSEKLRQNKNDSKQNATLAKQISSGVTPKIKSYYTLALSLPDGFTGRNSSRQKKLTKLLSEWSQQKAHRAWINSTAKKCASLSPDSKQNCSTHFAQLLKAQSSFHTTVTQ